MYEYVRVVKTVGKREPPLHTRDNKIEQVIIVFFEVSSVSRCF